MLLLLLCLLLPAQLDTKLEQQTIAAFDTYAKGVEHEMAERWAGRKAFLSAGDKQTLLEGKPLIRPGGARKNPIDIPDGLIHDWTGTIFLPDVSLDRVLAVLQDFDRHSQWYPEVVRSRLIRHTGNDLTGYWRLEKKEQLVDVVFDVTQEAHYEHVAPNRWTCRAYAKDVREVRDPGGHEKILSVGEGLGVFWRGYYYWSLEASGNGVLAEVRTLSLTRSIPTGMGWIMKPLLQNVPRESLTSTLENTRKAVTEVAGPHPSRR
jgi:hypothetical protein